MKIFLELKDIHNNILYSVELNQATLYSIIKYLCEVLKKHLVNLTISE